MHCETKDNKSIHIILRVLKKKRKKNGYNVKFSSARLVKHTEK